MAQHPDVQSKVQAELDKVVGRNCMPSISDHSNTPVTEATIAECYRLSGMVPATLPHRVENDLKIRGYDIPKGSYFTLNLAWMALSPDVWDAPKEFRPERFLDEDGNYVTKREENLAQFGIGKFGLAEAL